MEAQAAPRRDPERHSYNNIVIYVRDDVRNPVPDYVVEFFEHDFDTSARGRFFHRDVVVKAHTPRAEDHYCSMYVDTTLLYHRIDKPDVGRLEAAISTDPRVDDSARVDCSQDAGTAKLRPEAGTGAVPAGKVWFTAFPVACGGGPNRLSRVLIYLPLILSFSL